MYFATSSLITLITTLITADYYARLRRRAQLGVDVLRDELLDYTDYYTDYG